MWSRIVSLFLSISLLLLTTAALAEDKNVPLPDPALCYFMNEAIEDVSILVCPHGDGTPLSAAKTLDGRTLDAKVGVWILDSVGAPMYNFPFEDIWLAVDGLAMPVPGCLSDAPTDEQGRTEFALPLRAGGSTTAPVGVIVSGMEILGARMQNLRFNSPDLNGDLVVDLIDVGLFAQAFAGGYDYAADLYPDGVIDMADVGVLAQHFGHRHP